ncbi:Leucine-rich repeat and Leucine-rich repeat, typical subtype-containing protein [Strongyloides ratti]|uniref:Leucine-rich repeat and Leucine-rich repeat, typical subtype-containing protein n=1 Tax=Strongyloides ratti TaxID=34506 RepID=A0A090MRB0_STRRB|nr:Leucine-rich repeat and Leucine-rich repeat, typical subtype-containing protein [Strongyloides ratti]CEF60733.1 Leucine-rich repeat and Leucine-rich repeat, typical subtype-containing protein [Strongyloides ratti]
MFKISSNLLRSLYLFTFIILLTYQCPDILENVCQCVDTPIGLELNCSDNDGNLVVELLKTNKRNLGLIKKLILRNGRLTHISNNFFENLYIKELDLSNNEIVQIEKNAFKNMTSLLEELFLDNNKLQFIPSLALTPLGNSLKKLSISNNSISKIEEGDMLPLLIKLVDLNLSNNNIDNIHKKFFDNVKETIQTINFGYNSFKSIPASAIRGFKQLVSLHFHKNQIIQLESLSFMNLPTMNLLNLASNQINTIHKQTFLNVPALRYLYLSNNYIEQIPPYLFSSFTELEMIDLSSNKINILTKNSFSHLQNLHQLYLGENEIIDIENGSFTNSSLVILILESNKLTNIKADMFEGATKLQQLSLKNNKINNIESNAFQTTPSLVMIDLSRNKLIDIPPTTFLNQNNILLLDLSGNQIIRTPYGAFSKKVVTVLLQENPLVCTEKIHMLQEGVGVYIPNSDNKICKKEESIIKPISEYPITIDSTTLKNSLLNESKKNLPKEKIDNKEILKNVNINNNFEQDLIPVIEIDRETSDVDEKGGNLEDTLTLANLPLMNNQEEIEGNRGTPIDTIDSLSKIVTVDNYMNANKRTNINPLKYMPAVLPSSTTRRPLLQQTISPENNLPYINFSSPPPNLNFTDKPNVIYPFPVPFLKSGPKMSQSYASGNAPIPTYTLPPNIKITDEENEVKESINNNISNNFERIELGGKKDNSIKINHEKKEGEEQLNLSGYNNSQFFNHITIITICLTTVVLVMMSVFVGLCIAKYHQKSKNNYFSHANDGTISDSTRSAICHPAIQSSNLEAIYGTLSMNRNAFTTLNRRELQQSNEMAWMYNSGSYGRYYK